MTDLDPAPPLAIDARTADLLFTAARSVKEFAPGDVSDDEIAAVYDLIKWGPTAMNIVLLRVAIVRSPQARARLVTHMGEGNKARTAAAPLTLVAAADPSFHRHLEHVAPERVGMVEALDADRDRRERMARQSGLIQVGYLVVGLRAAGLQVGPMGGFDAAGLDADLFADRGWLSLLVLNVGRGAAEGGVRPRSPRLAAADAVAVL